MLKCKASLFTAGILLATSGLGSAFAQAASVPPYSINLLYTGEAWDNATGGIRTGTSYMQNVDGQFTINADQAFGWTGGKFYIEGYYSNSNSTGDQYVGAVDQQSPIDTAGYGMSRLYQAYYDQKLGDTDVLFGILDLETEFLGTKPMSLFLSKDLTWNTSYDMSGTMTENGTIGPGNYPYTPLTLRVRQTLPDHFSFQFAMADGASDNPKNPPANDIDINSRYGALGIGELDYKPGSHTKLMAGVWGLTSQLPAFGEAAVGGAQPMERGDAGGYVGGATRLYSQTPGRGLDGFFTVGIADPVPTSTSASINGGFTYTGPFAARPHDKIGFSFNENIASKDWKASQIAMGNGVESDETSFEVTYRTKINEWLTVQPDVQYIIHPGYNPLLKDDAIFGVHFEIGHYFAFGS